MQHPASKDRHRGLNPFGLLAEERGNEAIVLAAELQAELLSAL